MKLCNLLNACNVIAPTRDIRQYLNGVVIYLDPVTDQLAAMAATDGHRLVLITVNHSAQLRSCETVILSKKDIKSINLKYPELRIEDINIREILNDCEKIDGRYPDILRVIPADNRRADIQHIGVNAEYLADIFAVYKALTKGVKNKQYPCFKLNLACASDSILAFQDFDTIGVKYVLQPVRI